MLFPRWQKTLERFSDRPAIFGDRETIPFAELARRLAALPVAEGPVIARGTAEEIVLATLRGWRDGRPVLPLEKDAATPDLPAGFPPGTVHLKLTPGIEGRPRAVFFTPRQIAADADRLVTAMGLQPDTPNLAAISLSHSYGFSSIVLPLLLHGVPVRKIEVPFPQIVAAALAEGPPMVVQAVPPMWRAWHRSGILEANRIVLAVSAGAPLSLELERAVFASCGLKLHNFYGASECGGISFDTTRVPRDSAADLGSPLPGVSVEVHESGRLRVRSSSVAAGYDRARPGEILGEGDFLTQDFVRLEGGRILLESSGAESINVAGRKIGPARVEAVLMATGLVERVKIFGVASHDPERVEDITALVELKQTVAMETLRQAASSTLAGWEMPRHWIAPDDDETLWSLSRAELKRRGTRRLSES